MISVRLRGHQTVHHLIDLIEEYKTFKGQTLVYTIEFDRPPNYIIETSDRDLIHWIRDNCETNKIHRNEDR